MIIPMKPENVRITIQLTSADFAAGEFAHDIDLQKLYDNRNSCAYEFAIDYGGQIITNAYQLFYDDGTLYAAVFFTSTDGGTVKLTLSEGEGTIATSSTDLPAVTSADEGDVLTVNGSGEWVNAEPASQLPVVTGEDDGKVLMVSSGAWTAADLPVYSGGVS